MIRITIPIVQEEEFDFDTDYIASVVEDFIEQKFREMVKKTKCNPKQVEEIVMDNVADVIEEVAHRLSELYN